MIIKELGSLTQDPECSHYLTSEPVAIPYLNEVELPFVLDGLAFDRKPEEFLEAVYSFLNLQLSDRDQATKQVFHNYLSRRSDAGEDGSHPLIDREVDVWSHIKPTEVLVKRDPYGDKVVCVQIIAECDWEKDLGLMLLFRYGNDLVRVGTHDEGVL